jgi:hypothetical protein
MTMQEFEDNYLVKPNVTNNQYVLNVSRIGQDNVDYITPQIDLSNVSEMQGSFSPQVISNEIWMQAMALVYNHYDVEI